MDGQAGGTPRLLSRREASDAVGDLGWRYVLGVLRTCVRTGSLAAAADVAARSVAACGPDAGDHLRLDLRSDLVVLDLRSTAAAAVTSRDVALAARITAAVEQAGLTTHPRAGDGARRSVQALEIAIDALDIPSVRPFWKAVTGYTDAADAGATGPLVDPVGQGPAVWFQQMDAPRPQRNRIHLDISVPHDEAGDRVRAALTAGGALVSGASAPAFWVLADAEGNEACVSTWQGRDG